MIVRRATREDLPALYALYRHAFPVPWYFFPFIERWLRERELSRLVAADGNVYVLDNGCWLLGSVHLRQLGRSSFEVNNFCMRQDAGGVGVFAWANFFLESIIDCASALPVNLLWTSLKPAFGEACNRAARKHGLRLAPALGDRPGLRHYFIDHIPSYCARSAA